MKYTFFITIASKLFFLSPQWMICFYLINVYKYFCNFPSSIVPPFDISSSTPRMKPPTVFHYSYNAPSFHPLPPLHCPVRSQMSVALPYPIRSQYSKRDQIRRQGDTLHNITHSHTPSKFPVLSLAEIITDQMAYLSCVTLSHIMESGV